jgi:methylmalonyl-CoA mutase C-terminal domain/subunit
LQATPEEIAEIAKYEQVDIVGVSLLSGAHNSLMPRVIDSCKERGVDDVVYLLGGIIPQEDISDLLKAGVERVFGPGSNLDEIVNFALERVAEKSLNEIVSDMGTKSFNL